MSTMGVMIDRIEVPVCNSFMAKIFNDQLCYTVDPNKYRKFINNGNSANADELSLTLYINYNEDREESFSASLESMESTEKSDRHTGPMVTMVTRHTGGLYQLPVVEMSWGKNLRKKQVF